MVVSAVRTAIGKYSLGENFRQLQAEPGQNIFAGKFFLSLVDPDLVKTPVGADRLVFRVCGPWVPLSKSNHDGE